MNLKPGMTVVDGTLGAGGHSEAILEKILPGGTLISVDWDKRAVDNFEKKLSGGIFIAKRELIRLASSAPENINKKNDGQSSYSFIKLGNRKGEAVGNWCGAVDNYANIESIVRGSGFAARNADAVLVDLGFSSDQIEDAERGFSFRKNGPLDMRYSPEKQAQTAADIVNEYSESELFHIFKDFGEEKFAKRIAREIEKFRKVKKIEHTLELAEIVQKAIPEKFRRGKVHPATKVFQALRIETNQEFENLNNFLDKAMGILASEGILAIISFHSLEDRIVKDFFRQEVRDCVCPSSFPKCICDHRARLKILTKKPIMAGLDEIKRNPRARSAKLRVARKVAQK